MSTWPEVVHETCHVFMWFNMRPFRRHVLLLTQDSMLCRLVREAEFPGKTLDGMGVMIIWTTLGALANSL